jgi:hypothetical protein
VSSQTEELRKRREILLACDCQILGQTSGKGVVIGSALRLLDRHL